MSKSKIINWSEAPRDSRFEMKVPTGFQHNMNKAIAKQTRSEDKAKSIADVILELCTTFINTNLSVPDLPKSKPSKKKSETVIFF